MHQNDTLSHISETGSSNKYDPFGESSSIVTVLEIAFMLESGTYILSHWGHH